MDKKIDASNKQRLNKSVNRCQHLFFSLKQKNIPIIKMKYESFTCGKLKYSM